MASHRHRNIVRGSISWAEACSLNKPPCVGRRPSTWSMMNTFDASVLTTKWVLPEQFWTQFTGASSRSYSNSRILRDWGRSAVATYTFPAPKLLESDGEPWTWTAAEVASYGFPLRVVSAVLHAGVLQEISAEVRQIRSLRLPSQLRACDFPHDSGQRNFSGNTGVLRPARSRSVRPGGQDNMSRYASHNGGGAVIGTASSPGPARQSERTYRLRGLG